MFESYLQPMDRPVKLKNINLLSAIPDSGEKEHF